MPYQTVGDHRRLQTDLDKGIIHYPPLVKVAKETGMKYFWVEQEQYPSSLMQSMASNGTAHEKFTVLVKGAIRYQSIR